MPQKAEPFLRWAGGKRWLARRIGDYVRQRLSGTYFEPFVGAGAMFFTISPAKAELSDINSGLINAFAEVARNHERLIKELRRIPVDADNYYRIRSKKPRTSFWKAVRFIYLNRTCYGGLHRENKKGEFNVPFGGGDRTPRVLWERNLLANASDLLSSPQVNTKVVDFREAINRAQSGDVVYCDPVYRRANGHSFDRYGPKVFGWEDQVDLAALCRQAQSRGALVLLSNAYCQKVSEIFDGAQEFALVKSKTIGNRAAHDDSHKEVLLVFEPYGRSNSEWSQIIENDVGNGRISDLERHTTGQSEAVGHLIV